MQRLPAIKLKRFREVEELRFNHADRAGGRLRGRHHPRDHIACTFLVMVDV
jgi:hypothetical protein